MKICRVLKEPRRLCGSRLHCRAAAHDDKVSRKIFYDQPEIADSQPHISFICLTAIITLEHAPQCNLIIVKFRMAPPKAVGNTDTTIDDRYSNLAR